MPEDTANEKWDVILVDAPSGYLTVEEQPGRMASIYMAKQLIEEGGIIFVHDCEREVEAIYTDKFLGKENLIQEVFGRALMRMYRG